MYVNGHACKFIVNDRKPFVDTFKKVLKFREKVMTADEQEMDVMPSAGFTIEADVDGRWHVFKDGKYTGFTAIDKEWCREWIKQQTK